MSGSSAPVVSFVSSFAGRGDLDYPDSLGAVCGFSSVLLVSVLLAAAGSVDGGLGLAPYYGAYFPLFFNGIGLGLSVGSLTGLVSSRVPSSCAVAGFFTPLEISAHGAL